MKKLVLLLVVPFLLCGCNETSNPEGETKKDEQQQNNNEGKDLTRVETISSADFVNHIKVNLTWGSFGTTKYNDRGNVEGTTYTTVINGEISLLKEGYVTYEGSSDVTVSVSSSFVGSDGKTSSCIHNMKFTVDFSPSKKSCQVKYNYEHFLERDSEYEIQQYIPYSSTSGAMTEPVITTTSSIKLAGVSTSSTNITATYYHNGVSGLNNLYYSSVQITLANWQAYFSVSTNGINPIEPGKYYDYRVSMTVDGKPFTVRRDGTQTFYNELTTSVVSAVSGFIDVYPERVI